MLNKEHEPRNELKLKPSDRVALCRCWQSKNFPYCDGSHRQYNQDNQDCLGPVIVEFEG